MAISLDHIFGLAATLKPGEEAILPDTVDVRPAPVPTCEVCGTSENIAGVLASSVGPCSFCTCTTCLEKHAEPASHFAYLKEEVGPDVADFVHKLTTMKDGRYISYTEYCGF